MSQHKIVVYVPLTHTDVVREAIGKAGGGKLGKYSYCSFSTRVLRFVSQPINYMEPPTIPVGYEYPGSKIRFEDFKASIGL